MLIQADPLEKMSILFGDTKESAWNLVYLYRQQYIGLTLIEYVLRSVCSWTSMLRVMDTGVTVKSVVLSTQAFVYLVPCEIIPKDMNRILFGGYPVRVTSLEGCNEKMLFKMVELEVSSIYLTPICQDEQFNRFELSHIKLGDFRLAFVKKEN